MSLHNEGSCALCTGWHDVEEAAFMNRRRPTRFPPTVPQDNPDWDNGFIEGYKQGRSEAEARTGAALDVGEPGWLHPPECSNAHNEHGNCVADDGAVVGWREWAEFARLAEQSDV